MVALTVFTSSRWRREPEQIAPQQINGDRGRPSLPALAAMTTLAIYVQILIGAVMRHMGAGLAIPDFPLSFGHLVPPIDSDPVAINYAHRCGALLVAGLIVWTVVRVLGAHRGESWLRRPAQALSLLLVAQICLGAITVWSGRAVIPTTAHVAIGAAVLATSLTLTLRAFRLLRGSPISRSSVGASAALGSRVIDHRVTA